LSGGHPRAALCFPIGDVTRHGITDPFVRIPLDRAPQPRSDSLCSRSSLVFYGFAGLIVFAFAGYASLSVTVALSAEIDGDQLGQCDSVLGLKPKIAPDKWRSTIRAVCYFTTVDPA
jgi:hypothetical protein